MIPKKNLGQHFLTSDAICNRIVALAGDLSNHDVLEIGPGTGQLSRAILKARPSYLLTIEKDERLVKYRLSPEISNYRFILADALQVNECMFLRKPVKVIANLPYNIATTLLLQWLNRISLFSDFTLMFQKEVAQRLTAEIGNAFYGRLSILVQWLCCAQYHFEVLPKEFSPVPRVSSAVVTLKPYTKPLFAANKEHLQTLTKRLFNQRRKTLRAIFKKYAVNYKEISCRLNIDMSLRPEDLSVQQFCQLSQYFNK